MNNAIVTTTIQKPTEATLKFCEINNWDLIVVGEKLEFRLRKKLLKRGSFVLNHLD